MRKRLIAPRPRAGRPVRYGVLAVAVLVVVALGVAIVTFGKGRVVSASDPASDTQALVALESSVAEAGAAGTSADSIEVPALVGTPLGEARVLLAAAGLAVEVRVAGAPLPGDAVQTVERQEPAHGTLVRAGQAVVITVRPAATDGEGPSQRVFTVCIDPGHQSNADASPEPVGPASKRTKAKITAGVTGVATGLEEYEVALQIAMNLKRQLEDRGVRVVMTRTTNDVNLSNAERAQLATRVKADLLVRVHGGGSPDANAAGIHTLYPAANAWTKPVAARSRRAATAVHSAVVAATAAPDRGVKAYTDQAGFNWSRVPAVLVECGLLSNEVEDRLLASPHYQDSLAQGMADGIVAYLEAEEDR